jgi:hypothetical protein
MHARFELRFRTGCRWRYEHAFVKSGQGIRLRKAIKIFNANSCRTVLFRYWWRAGHVLGALGALVLKTWGSLMMQ